MTQAIETTAQAPKMRGCKPSTKFLMRYFHTFLDIPIFLYADNICRDYSGGRWKFRANGEVGYLYPDSKKTFHCVNPAAHYECETTGEVLGLAACCFFLNHSAWKAAEKGDDENGRWFSQQFYALRNWAMDNLPEEQAAQLYWLLD